MFFTKYIFINQERSKLMSVAKPQKAKAPKNCHICGSSKHVVKYCVLKERYFMTMDVYMKNIIQNIDRQLKIGNSDLRVSELLQRDTDFKYLEKNMLKYGVWIMQNHGMEYSLEYPFGDMITFTADKLNKSNSKNDIVRDFYECYISIGTKYFEWKKKDKKEKEISCSICLEELEGKPTCTTLCNHTFCSSCFHRHVGRSYGRGNDGYNCPLCRAINN